MYTFPRMIASQRERNPMTMEDVESYAEAMGGDLAILCVNAGRPDAAMDFLRAVLTLRRRPSAQLPEVKAADGDAA